MLYIIFKMPDVCKSATYWRRAVVPPSSSYLITHKISDTKKPRFYCIHLVRLETIPIKIRIKEIPLFFRLFATVISARQPETTWFSLSAEITYTLHSKERHTCLYSVRSHIFYVPVTPKMPVSQHKRHQFSVNLFVRLLIVIALNIWSFLMASRWIVERCW